METPGHKILIEHKIYGQDNVQKIVMKLSLDGKIMGGFM